MRPGSSPRLPVVALVMLWGDVDRFTGVGQQKIGIEELTCPARDGAEDQWVDEGDGHDSSPPT
jgi:hypothetical protein